MRYRRESVPKAANGSRARMGIPRNSFMSVRIAATRLAAATELRLKRFISFTVKLRSRTDSRSVMQAKVGCPGLILFQFRVDWFSGDATQPLGQSEVQIMFVHICWTTGIVRKVGSRLRGTAFCLPLATEEGEFTHPID